MRRVRRGDIWQVRFAPVEGSARPALVLQNNIGNRFAGTTIVAAITGTIKGLPTLVEIQPSSRNGLKETCAVNLSQLRTISKSRLVTLLGRIEDEYMAEIENATLISLGFR